MLSEMFEEELNLDAGWSIGEAEFSHLISRLQLKQPTKILEFGGGRSTIRLAMSMPGCKIVTIDHDEYFLDNLRALKQKYAPKANLEILFRPLTWQWYNFSLYKTYAIGPMIDRFDAIIIDGPPFYVLGGREACLYLSIHHLAREGLIFLHDYSRQTEKKAVQNWFKVFPNCFRNIEITEERYGICSFEKVVDRAVPKVNFRIAKANYRLNLAIFHTYLRKQICI